MSAELKCKGCNMEATEDRWDYAMVYPALRSTGGKVQRRVKVLVCPVCGQTRKPPDRTAQREASKARHPSVGDLSIANNDGNVVQFPMDRVRPAD